MAITNTAEMHQHEQRLRDAAEFKRRFANRETTEKEESDLCSQVSKESWQSWLDMRARVDRAIALAAVDANVPEIVAALRAVDQVNPNAVGVAIAFGLALLIELIHAESLARREREKNVSG